MMACFLPISTSTANHSVSFPNILITFHTNSVLKATTHLAFSLPFRLNSTLSLSSATIPPWMNIGGAKLQAAKLTAMDPLPDSDIT